jgi:hypothetical protein
MRKIPTVYQRDPANRALVLDQVTPGCEWVLAGEGVATRKVDGVCTMFDGLDWWARREQFDPDTGKAFGWAPIGDSPFARFHTEALTAAGPRNWVPGTYELCGPKINRNPEHFLHHELIRHGQCLVHLPGPLNYQVLRERLGSLAERGVEGVVWWHPDGRLAKLKARDFGAERPARATS